MTGGSTPEQPRQPRTEQGPAIKPARQPARQPASHLQRCPPVPVQHLNVSSPAEQQLQGGHLPLPRSHVQRRHACGAQPRGDGRGGWQRSCVRAVQVVVVVGRPCALLCWRAVLPCSVHPAEQPPTQPSPPDSTSNILSASKPGCAVSAACAGRSAAEGSGGAQGRGSSRYGRLLRPAARAVRLATKRPAGQMQTQQGRGPTAHHPPTNLRSTQRTSAAARSPAATAVHSCCTAFCRAACVSQMACSCGVRAPFTTISVTSSRLTCTGRGGR